MTGFDYAAIAVIGLSTLLSLWRGAVQQVFSLAAWGVALVVANHFAPWLQGRLPDDIEGETTRFLVAVVGLFIAALVATTGLGRLLAGALRAVGLGSADRVLGVLLGFVRGVLVVLVAVALAGMTPLPQTLVWREAKSSAWFVQGVEWARPSLPQAFASRIRYD